jgi:hypothetical protein
MVCQAGASLLLIDRLQIAGKRPLEAAEFVRGYLNRPEAPGWVPPQQPNRLLRELSN